MKIATKLFMMAALALMTAACDNEDNNFTQQPPITPQPQGSEGITITAQLGPKSKGDTRTLSDKTSYIEAKWAVDDEIAILYKVSDTKYAAKATVTDVNETTGAATITFTVDGGTANNTPCTLIYPYSAANDKHDGLKDVGELLGDQDGTLNTNPNLDLRVGAGTIYTVTPRLSVTTQPAAQYAIFKFTTKNSDASANIDVKELTITTGTENFVITPVSAKNELYAALPPLTGEAISFVAKGSDDHYYYMGRGEVTFTAGQYYHSTIKMTKLSAIDLSTILTDFTAQDNDILTDTLGANVKISIADGATVTLFNANINGTNNSSYSWAGLTCLGNATIILADGTTNNVKGFNSGYSGIYVPSGKTLIIKGETVGSGKLNASCNVSGAGIGGSINNVCGNIEIQGGVIKATGGANGAGIGSYGTHSCGTITITGGRVNATGGANGAGIGSGQGGHCTSVTITNAVKYVEAKRGTGDTKNVGPGDGGTCGKVTIGGTVYWDNNAYQNDGERLLYENNVLLYPF